MSTVICTLFENHYHYGLAALVNSLSKRGFKGDIYAGYKGDLPTWAANVQRDLIKGEYISISENIKLYFISLATDYHLTNYKPDFMLNLLNGPAKGADSIFYFDPDIVLVAPWAYFLEWISCGVALSEDVNSPLSEFHPRRVAWRKYFASDGISLTYKSSIYVNGGFVGVHQNDFGFINKWKEVQESMGKTIGGLSRSAFKAGQQLDEQLQGDFAPFGKTDQDALNATIEAWRGNVSLMGKEAMGFQSGTLLMPHALGSPKPWRWNVLKQAINGRSPRVVDRMYWESASGPIKVYADGLIKRKKLAIQVAAFLGRFYKRGGL